MMKPDVLWRQHLLLWVVSHQSATFLLPEHISLHPRICSHNIPMMWEQDLSNTHRIDLLTRQRMLWERRDVERERDAVRTNAVVTTSSVGFPLKNSATSPQKAVYEALLWPSTCGLT